MAMDQPAPQQETVRGFWHGSPLGPYQLLCLRSFVDHGHRMELYTYDDTIAVPDWIVRRDARDVLPTEHVLHYQTGFGRGSPSLHANLFRYTLLDRLGGWWTDLDVLLLSDTLPEAPYFFARAADPYTTLNNSVLKFPAGDPLLRDAVDRCNGVAEADAVWGQTGPLLLTSLVDQHALRAFAQPAQAAYPIPWQDVAAMFDPARCVQIQQRIQGAIFLHMFNEIWRGSGIPRELGPPAGSFLDACFRLHDFGHRFREVMNFADVVRWIGNRRDKIMLEETVTGLEHKYQTLERQYQTLENQYQTLDARLQQLQQLHAPRAPGPIRRVARRIRELLGRAGSQRQ